jgi:hypothetical protein
VGSTVYVLVVGNDATARTLSFNAVFQGSLPSITDATSTKHYLLAIVCVDVGQFGVSSLRVK